MVSAIVYADDSGNGNDGNSNDGNSNGVNGNVGNGNRDNRNNGDVGRGNSTDGRGNDMNAVNKDANDHKNTSDAGNKTPVVQHTVSTPVVQAPAVVLLVTYSAGTASAVTGAWWEPEGLLRRFFFLFGSIGEKIRRKDVLRNRKRREIYYFVLSNPFAHFRRITRMVRVGPNQCSWHLRILEKMGFITSERVGRYLTYHTNNPDCIDGRAKRPATLIPNSNATKILEYLLRNPGVKIVDLSQALMMNRHTISYHIKRMQTSGLVERLERNGLRLSPIAEDHEERPTHLIASTVASRIETALTKIDSSS